MDSLDISKDKLYTLQHLASYGLPIPKTMIAKFPIDIKAIEREFTYPLILKKSSGSQGKGVMLVRDADALEDISTMVDTSQVCDYTPLSFLQLVTLTRYIPDTKFPFPSPIAPHYARVYRKELGKGYSCACRWWQGNRRHDEDCKQRI